MRRVVLHPMNGSRGLLRAPLPEGSAEDGLALRQASSAQLHRWAKAGSVEARARLDRRLDRHYDGELA